MALAAVLRRKSRDYLEHFGFGTVEVRLVYHQWMGAFPNDRDRADHLIATSAFMARLAGVDKLVTKTRDEAFGIPTIDANTRAVRQVIYGLECMGMTSPPGGDTIEREVELISGEVDHLLSAIFDQPGESFWHGVYRSVKSGMIDVPFAPHGSNANRLLALRDGDGAIRIREPGGVPVRDDDLARERACLDGRDDGGLSIVDRLTGDIMVMAREMLV